MVQSNVTINSYSSNLMFSICTIVNDDEQYRQMKLSFENAGFNTDTEYLIADNRESNNLDAYQAIKWFFETAAGQYIIVVHQDVICKDQRSVLENIVELLNNKDQNWAVAGNAGCNGYHSCYFHLINAGKLKMDKGLPRKVNSLDENFLMIRAERKPAISNNLTGFHLYGTDLCLNAIEKGSTCYVIPFLAEHLSMGNQKELEKQIPRFIEVHSNQPAGRFIQTTCAKFYLGKSVNQSRIYNSPFMFGLVKFWQRINKLFS